MWDSIFLELSDEDIQVQAILFFFAGFDTVSTTLSIAVSQIAEHPEVQEKIHEEIEEILKLCNGQPTYEVIRDMKYLDMVLSGSNNMILSSNLGLNFDFSNPKIKKKNAEFNKNSNIRNDRNFKQQKFSQQKIRYGLFL